MTAHPETYDFIIVGSGPAGCALAATLAQTNRRPKVLLLEAGGHNNAAALRVDGKRWSTFKEEEAMNWGYKTTPQEHCNGRQIDYSRGKCLGGGSAINFGAYTVGARDDYDAWAEMVGDATFSWPQMQRRFKQLETFDGVIEAEVNQKYGQPRAEDHGDKGALRIGYARQWEEDLPLALDAFEQAGLPRNLDHNSGNPIGMGLTINSSGKGMRSTAVDLLVGAPENLAIVTDASVQRILLEGKKAVGVETKETKYLASHDIILSAGSLDTPKILFHSGIGPSTLSQFSIPVHHNLPSIGQGLKDHFSAPLIVTRNPSTNTRNEFFHDKNAIAAAFKQWEIDGTGPWAKYGCQVGSGWFKSERITSTPEFDALPDATKAFMNRETIPHYEIITNRPIHWSIPDRFQDYSYICLAVFLMNEQSSGEVRLQSSNPDDPLLFDPKCLEHPFDRRACIEMYKHLLDVTDHPSFAKDTVSTMLGPKSRSDEDILHFWRQNLSSSWHMTGTVKMGKAGQSDAAVDSHFRVLGMESLRVADMSVVPVLTNNHTQATAYVTGLTCAEVLIEEYQLDV